MDISKAQQKKFRQLAIDGYGDDVIYDASGTSWVVFRLHANCPPLSSSFNLYVENCNSDKVARIKIESA